MSAEIENDAPGAGNVLTTNFDTYTLILQLVFHTVLYLVAQKLTFAQGCILNTVPAWKKTYKVRVAVFVEYESDVNEEKARVRKLLENLRIQAEVMVMWLANGELRTYEAIVNGGEEENNHVEAVLGKEDWWKELQKRRGRASSRNAPDHLADVAQLVSGAQWPSSSFQQQRRYDSSRMMFGGLNKLIKKSRKRHSIFGLAKLGMPLSLNMQTHRLNPEALDHGSASELSSDGESSDTLSSDGESIKSAASENDVDEYPTNEEPLPATKVRRASTGDPLGFGNTFRKQNLRQTALRASAAKSIPTMIVQPKESSRSGSLGESSKTVKTPSSTRPELPHRSSTPIFSCKAIPDTQVAVEEGVGPSIMFADTRANKVHSSAQINPLSFNDLPSRAQHLILNELIRKYSHDTAVVFTTLPSPQSNTSKSEKDSVEYLAGLEV